MQIKNLSVVDATTSFQVFVEGDWRWVGLSGNATAAAIIAAAVKEIAEAEDDECPCMGTQEGCEICCPFPGEGEQQGVGGGDYTPSPKENDEIPF